MAKAGGPRPRALAGIFSGYFLVVAVLAYVLAGSLSPYDAPGYIRWIGAAYVLLGAAAMVGVCVAAVRRAWALDERMDRLEAEERVALDAAREAVAPPVVPAPAPQVSSAGPSDADVEQLLADLHRIGQSAAAEPEPAEVPPRHGGALKETSDLRFAMDELDRLREVRQVIVAYAAGPAVASAGLLGVFTSLMPASDGMLTDVWLNAFVGIAGLGGLVGVAAYAGIALRRLRRLAD